MITFDTFYTIQRVSGLSQDDKPMGMKPGSVFMELDTGKKFIFDGEAWHEQPTGGGGGGKGYDEYNVVLTEDSNTVQIFTGKHYRSVELHMTVKGSENQEAVVVHADDKYMALGGTIQTGYFIPCIAWLTITGEKAIEGYNGYKASLGFLTTGNTAEDFPNDYIGDLRIALPTETNKFVAGSSFYLRCYE